MVRTFKNILLPVDFSQHCDLAAEHAAWFAKQSGGTVHLVHVVANPGDSLYEPGDVPVWAMVDHAGDKARALLADSARNCLPADCPRTLNVVHGDPFDKLMQVIEQLPADLVVMSTHGRGGIAHLIIGSVAEKIVRHAPCPVFIVRRASAA